MLRVAGNACIGIWFWLVAAYPAAAAITLQCEAEDGMFVAGDLVTVECTISTTEPTQLVGINLDLPCSISPAGGGPVGLVMDDMFVDLNHQDPPSLFGLTGIWAVNAMRCTAGITGNPFDPFVILGAEESAYLVTIVYRAVDCASGEFVVDLENFSDPPDVNDQTKIRRDPATLLSFSAVGDTIEADTPDGLECDDGNPCQEPGLCEGGFCVGPHIEDGTVCDDGLFCTSEGSCQNGECVSTGDPCPGQLCDEERNICVDCIFNEDCDDGNTCTRDVCVNDACAIFPNHNDGLPCDDGLFCTAVDRCGDGACVGTSSPCFEAESCDEGADACIPPPGCALSIVASDPPSGAIDARQDRNIDGTNPAGWDSVLLTFNADASCVTEDLLGVAATGGAIPGISSISALSNTVEVQLDGPIPVGHWTQIQFDGGSAGVSQVCLGFLPADVTGDGTSSSVDILRVVDCLNQVASCALHQADVNRSGLAESSDILRVVDLLNGAGAFESWNNRSLPANESCP